MENYFVQGIVLPERAKFELKWAVKGTHLASGEFYSADITIVCNQVAIWLESDVEIQTLDLKHLVNYIVVNQLSAVSYIVGCVFDFQVTRVINRSRGVDYVYGIENNIIYGRRSQEGFELDLAKIRDLQLGMHGMLIHRCLVDLTSAMRYREDTPFYCYRAIESLKHHYCLMNDISTRNDGERWANFRDGCGFSREQIMWVSELAKDLRHGNISTIDSEQCGELLRRTWDVVDSYLGI
jgi:hypothetical protein